MPLETAEGSEILVGQCPERIDDAEYGTEKAQEGRRGDDRVQHPHILLEPIFCVDIGRIGRVLQIAAAFDALPPRTHFRQRQRRGLTRFQKQIGDAVEGRTPGFSARSRFVAWRLANQK